MSACPICTGRRSRSYDRQDSLCARCYVRLVLGLPTWLVDRYRARWLGQVLP